MGLFSDYTALQTTGPTTAATLPNPATLLTDTIPGDRTTTASVVVDGAPVYSTINTLGDMDFFKVQLTAGETYQFGMYSALATGPSGVPLQDAFLEIYDSQGHLLGQADGGGDTTLNATNSGFDALLAFIAPTSGTYYLNARAFDQDPTNGTGGDGVGDYQVFAQTTDPRTAYHPLYPIDSPLNAIDWGTQVDGSVRDPDGDSGPRPTGATFTGVHHDDTYGVTGKNVITYYFAKAGDVFVDDNPTTVGSTETMVAKGMADWEKAAFKNVLSLYAQVADITYIEVANRAEADFKFVTYDGTPGAGASLLGRMSPPDEENEGQGEFNAGDVRWTQEGLAQGGFAFPTLVHEIGHGHGLAHPHDNGGHSSVMRGTDDGSVIGGGLGDYDLNQQVYTIMSYNDGYATSPYGGPSAGDAAALGADQFGWMGTLGAFDIAVIQDKYGVNEDWATGNDVYELKDVNGPGTFYSCIWDAGGTDEIRYSGAKDANIDLRAATLKYEPGGGGWVSYASGVYGGFTIANGVTIENATSGSGNDMLTGNAAANKLASGDGADVVHGGDGADSINGGAGADKLWGDGGDDRLTGSYGADQFCFAAGAGHDTVADYQDGIDRIGFFGITGVDDFSDLRLAAETHGTTAGVAITYGDGANVVWVSGALTSQFTAGDFLFG